MPATTAIARLEVDTLDPVRVPADSTTTATTNVGSLSRIILAGSGGLAHGGENFTLEPGQITSITFTAITGGGDYHRLAGNVAFVLTPSGAWKNINGATGDTTTKPVASGSMLHVLGSLTTAGAPLSWGFDKITAIRWVIL